MPRMPGTLGSNQRQQSRYSDKFRLSAAKRGYGRDWRALRQKFLRANPLCAQCEKRGRIKPAVEVDHIIPLTQGGPRMDPRNLQALCRPCHSSKTVREDGGFGRPVKPVGDRGVATFELLEGDRAVKVDSRAREIEGGGDAEATP